MIDGEGGRHEGEDTRAEDMRTVRRSAHKKVRRHILGLSVCFCQPVETGNYENNDKIN